jgi:hypothetical protein
MGFLTFKVERGTRARRVPAETKWPDLHQAWRFIAALASTPRML